MNEGDQTTLGVVKQTQVRLAHVAGREMLKRRAWWAVGAGAVAAACRPLALRLADEAPRWAACTRAIELFAAGSAVAAAALVALGRRRGPSLLGAARALDDKLGLSEVVASGFAFARDGREEPLALVARRRAGEAVEGARVAELFPLPSLRPAWRTTLRYALCAALAITVGSWDRGLAQALISPPTTGEREAAADLEEAAAVLAEHLEKPEGEKHKDPESRGREKGDDRGGDKGSPLADTAREAARAAKRGDRKGALEKLEGLRSAGAKQAARADGIGKALRKMAEALDAPKGKNGGAGKPAQPGSAASEAMRLLAQKVRDAQQAAGGEGSDESKERMLERLERAAEEARKASEGGKGDGSSEAARALSKAAQELSRGDREAAAQALEQAAARAASMEEMRAAANAEAMAIAEMLERSGALERAIQMAMLGKDGKGKGQGQGEGEGIALGEGGEKGKDGKGGAASALRSAILARLAAMGANEPDGDPGNGSGPHLPDHHRAKREPLAAQGSMRAPSQVTEGERAIQAINGLGKGGEPPASYREVFPSYDAAAEEGIADERVPAQRRAAVRRYFQAIRPEQP